MKNDLKTTISAIVGILVFLLARYGIEVPNDVQISIALATMGVIAYFAGDKTQPPRPPKAPTGQRTNALSLTLILALILSSLTACSENSFKKALEASKDLGANTGHVVDRVSNLYEQKAISKAQKDHLATLLIRIAQGGKKGHEVLIKLSEQYKTLNEVPKHEWFDVDKFFNDEVVLPFLELLTVIAGLSSETSSYLRVAISNVRTVILLLSRLLNKQTALEREMTRIEGGVYV